jgi:predicted amidohydrolase
MTQPIFCHEITVGTPSSKGNLIGIQPVMSVSDYRNQAVFEKKIDAYLAQAQSKHWLSNNTVVLFPEFLSSWLVAANENDKVYQATQIKQAMKSLIFRHLYHFTKTVPFETSRNKFKSALFRMKSQLMLSIYQKTFSALAKKYGITIVAGSIVLPDAFVENGVLNIHPNGCLYNTTVVYDINGNAYPDVVKKAFPVNDELEFLSSASFDTLPVFETLAGRVGVLICADSWYPETYRALRMKQPDIIAVPGYVGQHDYMNTLWKGYESHTPSDVDLSKPGNMTEHQAWMDYALPSRIHACGAKYGMTVFLRGHFWDIGSDGAPIIVSPAGIDVGENSSDATIANLWL